MADTPANKDGLTFICVEMPRDPMKIDIHSADSLSDVGTCATATFTLLTRFQSEGAIRATLHAKLNVYLKTTSNTATLTSPH